MVTGCMFIWCIHTKRKSCDASHSRSSAGDQYDSDNSKKWRDHVYLDNKGMRAGDLRAYVRHWNGSGAGGGDPRLMSDTESKSKIAPARCRDWCDLT